MKPLNVPAKDQVDETAQQIFEKLESGMGRVPNIYATMGYNGNVLKNYMEFDSGAGKSFSSKEKEAIKLAVSEVNGCEYCLAAHTALAQKNGFSEEETYELRAGTIDNEKLATLTQLARETAQKGGKVTESIRDRFFELGYQEKELIDFVAVVLGITFTNYIHNLTEIPVDFPEVKALDEVLAEA